jgi:ribosomal protein S18 acetylase RimI-like enzyme
MKVQAAEIIIRDANQTDIETLLNFEQEVIAAERPFDPTLKAETTYYDLHSMMNDSNVKLVVAEVNEQVIGSGYARIEKSKHFSQHSHHAYLGFMYVLPAFRGRGINGKIIECLKNWAQKQGLTEMRLEVYQGNTAAIKAYEKFGFSMLVVEMRCGI